MKLYLAAIDDYRFQVTLTWSRTQYCLTLNAALLSVAAALYKTGSTTANVLDIGVLSAGLIISIFSIMALDSGRRYYDPVVARMRMLESALKIEEYSVRNTARQGGRRPPLKVTWLIKGLLYALIALDLAGILYLALTANS